MPGGPRWPALAINPSQELEADVSSIEGALSQLNTAVTQAQGLITSLQGEAAGHVLRAGDTMTGDLNMAAHLRMGRGKNIYLPYADTNKYATAEGWRVDVSTAENFRVLADTGSGFVSHFQLNDDGKIHASSPTDNITDLEIFPRGILYDFGIDTTGAGGTLNAWPENIAGLAATATVPNGVSVTIMVWCWIRVNLTVDQEYAALDVLIDGTLVQNPALVEQDLTSTSAGTGATGSGGTGSTGSGGTGSTSTSGASHTHTHDHAVNSGNTGTTSGHLHSSGSLDTDNDSTASSSTNHLHTGPSHTHSGPSHTHTGPSHTHALSGSWHTLYYCAARSFTPSSGTVTLQARGGTAGGTAQTYDDGVLMYQVILN